MENNYLNLYIIGNGFDRYHELQTMYKNFYFYIEKNEKELMNTLSLYYNIAEPDDRMESQPCTVGWLWADFEQALEYFDKDYLEQWVDDIPYAGSEDPRDQDIDSVKGLAYDKLLQLKDMLQKAFNSWVKSITINVEPKIKFGDKSLFFSFNYTETLQKTYKIPNDLITHIHGKVGDESDLIFGHGWDYKKQLEKEAKENVEFEEANEQRSPKYPRHIAVENDVNRFLSIMYKNTEQISWNYYEFFESLISVKNICILGHSLSSVDMFYFQEIAQQIDLKTVKWYISYFNQKDIEAINNFLETLQIPSSNVVEFQISEFQECKPIIENNILQTF